MINDTIESTARALTRAALDAHAAAQPARDTTQPAYWTGIDRRIGPPTRRTGDSDRRAAGRRDGQPERRNRTKTLA